MLNSLKSGLLVVMLSTQGVGVQAPDYVASAVNANSYLPNRININAPRYLNSGKTATISIKSLDIENDQTVQAIWFFDEASHERLAQYQLTSAMQPEGIWFQVEVSQSRDLYAVAKLSDGSSVTGRFKVERK